MQDYYMAQRTAIKSFQTITADGLTVVTFAPYTNRVRLIFAQYPPTITEDLVIKVFRNNAERTSNLPFFTRNLYQHPTMDINEVGALIQAGFLLTAATVSSGITIGITELVMSTAPGPDELKFYGIK